MKKHRRMSRTTAWVLALAASGMWAAGVARPAVAQPAAWTSAGNGLFNSHAVLSPPGATQLNTSNVGSLKVKWTFTSSGNITATPTVEQGGLYVPDWGGYLYKIDPATGTLLWRHAVSEYTGKSGSYARVSPAIGPDTIVFGERGSGTIIAVSKATGALVWKTLVEAHPSAAFSSSPVIYNNVVYVGVGSTEEVLGTNTTYVPTFRGSVVALDLATGAILWKFVTVPAGYSGGGSWGSNPVVSTRYHALFVGTGNNYGVPASVSQCVASAGTGVAAQLACLDPTDYVDSLLALDLTTGHLKWARRVQGADAWTVGCNQAGLVGCPTPRGRDADFASAPNLITMADFMGVADDRGGTSQGYLLGAGQKSGTYWGLNPANGGLFWSRKIGPGEIVWGSAVDLSQHKYVFVALSNNPHSTYTLAGRNGVAQTWNAGSWAAIDTHTGQFAWQVPATGKDLVNPSYGASAPGALSFTNNILFAGDTSGYLTALSPTGLVKWTYATGASVVSAPAIFNDMVFWGVGAPHLVAGNTLYAFSVQ